MAFPHTRSLMVALAVLALARLATAGVTLSLPTDRCHPASTLGIVECCCDGDCVGGRPPQSEWTWGIGCEVDFAALTTGGDCYGTACQLEKWQYNYLCCDCPPGYISTAWGMPNCDTLAQCVGCDNSWETPYRGLNCSTVDILARNYDIAAQNGPNAIGYYGQLLNLGCLRSNCSKTAACQRVASFQSPDPECQSLVGDFEFEQTVFGEAAAASDEASVKAAAKEADDFAAKFSAAFQANQFALGRQNPLLVLALQASGATDPSTLGTTYAGISHFAFDLLPNFSSYIHDLVQSTPDNQALQVKLRNLAEEHERLFKCAVGPGFEVQASRGEILPIPALIGSAIVPLAARELRNGLTVAELIQANRFVSFEAMDLLGISVPKDPRLQWNPRNWVYIPPTSGGNSNLPRRAVGLPPQTDKPTSLTELSPMTDANPLISLALGVQTLFNLQIKDRDNNLEPVVAQSSFISVPPTYPNLASPYDWKITNDTKLRMISPIAAIYPAIANLATINSTHVMAGNVSSPPITLDDYLSKGQGGVTSDPSKYTMYPGATVSMSLPAEVLQAVQDPATELVLYDLVSGLALPTTFTPKEGGGGDFMADVKPGQGVSDGQWAGGGSYGVGLTDAKASEAGAGAGAGDGGSEDAAVGMRGMLSQALTLLIGLGTVMVFAATFV